MNKIILAFFSIVFIYSCSYEPIFLNKNINFNFKEINFEGNSEVNNIIKNNLLNRANGDVEYSIFFKSDKKKIIISSDAKGDPSIYKIEINLVYETKKDKNLIFKNNLKKQVTYNNIDDKFELSKYEENIITSIANNLSEEIILSIISIDK